MISLLHRDAVGAEVRVRLRPLELLVLGVVQVVDQDLLGQGERPTSQHVIGQADEALEHPVAAAQPQERNVGVQAEHPIGQRSEIRGRRRRNWNHAVATSV